MFLHLLIPFVKCVRCSCFIDFIAHRSDFYSLGDLVFKVMADDFEYKKSALNAISFSQFHIMDDMIR